MEVTPSIAAVVDNGLNRRTDAAVNSEVESIIRQFSSLSINGVDGRVQKSEKDPRRIARKYQLDLCKKAMEENTIVYLGTGCGKTHIAVLLIYEMRHLIKKPQNNICVFLAPTVALVEQQASVIQDSLDFKVGIFCGNSTGKKSHREWEKDIARYEVFVMTPQTLVQNLSHCFIRIDQIALLIFDECHYAQTKSNHPYAEIMKIFYKSDVAKLPRVFGMTASPQFGKDASINSLEALLHAKIYSVEDEKELELFVASPKLKIYYYSTHSSSSLEPHKNYSTKLDQIKNKCLSTLRKNSDVLNGQQTKEMSLHKLHGNMLLCLENLGIWGALQASRILSRTDEDGDESEVHYSGNSVSQEYLSQIASAFASDCSKVNVNGTIAEFSSLEILDEPFFSRKLLLLIGILMNFRSKPDMKCIVFVDRIIMARSLAHILGNLKFLSSWKPEFLVGVNNGLMSRKDTNVILDKFRSGELNLLVATKVGEEGLDIQTCCLVIRFDLPQNCASYIQSRGRARMAQSEYAFLVDSGNEMELKLINNFIKSEEKMNEEIASRMCTEKYLDSDERIYRVDSTGATVSDGSSVSLLHRYCSKLPHDEFFHPKPQFFYFDDSEGRICSIILPSNAPIHQIVSSPQSSGEAAKKDACLKACEQLHKLGALTDYLLQDDDDDDVDELLDGSSDFGGSKDESRRELHEMVIPAVLREPWTHLEDINFNSYIIKFKPDPADRIYKEFGLFVKSPLPLEAETMKIDLHLARGRHVHTELVPNGVETFDKDQVILGEKFQELCLTVILDRSKLIHEFVSLRETNYKSSSTTFYLMLPMIVTNGNVKKLRVDWKLVRRCLSSPIFRSPANNFFNGIHITRNYLHLADGTKSVADIVNSFVYAPCKNIFFFVSDIVYDKNGYSAFNKSVSHVVHYADVFNINLLYPNQPLLKAKRLFCVENLLRKNGHSESREKQEHFIDLPPEICQLKIIGFSKDIGSSLSLLPSIMHRLENLLVAIQLKHRLSASFHEGAKVTAARVLEALTTEKCSEKFSLERLEVLGDAFLKFAVGRHLFLLHDALDEGQLTRKRSNLVNNSNLCKLAIMKNLQVYIRDWSFEPSQFFALGRPCLLKCTKEAELTIHASQEDKNNPSAEIRCSKCHNWLYRKTIADVVEALIGAFLVDSGFKAATAFLKWIGIKVDFKADEITKIYSSTSPFMSLSSQIDISALENTLGYRFTHKGLLIQAFVHPSYNTSYGGCYQRLEFLGDAVLDYLMTSYLYSVYPKLRPGQLTDLRSLSVNNISFADVAVSKSFHKFVICDSVALRQSMKKYVDFIESSASDVGPTEARCPKALGDLVESYIGAVLLDTGFDLERVWNLMLSFLDPIMKYTKLQLSPIRQLHELCQSRNWNLEFPTAKKVKGGFFVEAKVNGEGIYANSSATALSIKDARKMAAKKLFSRLKAEGYPNKSLEEVLKTSQKMEAKLIGFDENSTYSSVNPQIDKIPNVFFNRKVHPISAESRKPKNPNVGSTSPLPPPHQHPRNHNATTSVKINCKSDLEATEGKSFKSLLHEICLSNHWAPPLYECWKETGPDHLKEYIFKVVVVIKEMPKPMLECYGETRRRKKEAAEHAAEGALWYLKNGGYFQD